MECYRSIVAVVGGLVITAAGLAGTADAVGTCSSSDANFCVTYGLAANLAGTTTAANAAAAPVDVSASVANTSADQSSTTTHWLDHVVLTLFNGLGGKAYTPSNQLDNNLIVAGSSSTCSAADFSDCTAGQGTFWASVSGAFSGFYPGSFGIQRITNVNPTTVPGADLQWDVAMTFCVHDTPLPVPCQNESFTASAASAGSGTVLIPTRPATPFSYSGISVDASLSTAEIHLKGLSSTLSDGTAASHGQQTVMHLPTRCGVANAAATLVDRGTGSGGASISVPLTQTVTGCPTARFAKSEHLLTAHFDGTTSTTPIAGRTIKRWHWSFGDGTSRVTTGPKVAHTYSSSRNRTVRLVVEDSLGALSTARSWLLRGTAMSWSASASRVSPGTAVTLSGRLTKWHSSTGLGGRSVRIQRCRVGTNHCTLVKTVTTSRHAGRVGKFSVVVHPTAAGDYRATYFGGGGYLGIRRSHRITMR